MAEQIRITVKYDRRVTVKRQTPAGDDGKPTYGSDETSEFAACGVEFPDGLTIDSRRELDQRLELAFRVVRERVMRETEPPTDLFVKIRKAFEAAQTVEALDKLDSLMAERFNAGLIGLREVNWLSEIGEDCRVLLAIPLIDIPEVDAK